MFKGKEGRDSYIHMYKQLMHSLIPRKDETIEFLGFVSRSFTTESDSLRCAVGLHVPPVPNTGGYQLLVYKTFFIDFEDC